MRPITTSILLALSCVFGFNALASERTLDGIVAIVNNDIITQSEVDARLHSTTQQLQALNAPMPNEADLIDQVVERLVEEHLIMQQADLMGIHIDDRMLNQAMISIAEGNGTDLAGFRSMVEADGYDYIEFREDIRKDMLLNQVQQARVGHNVTITDEEITHLVEELQAQNSQSTQYRVGHILISLPRNPSSAQVQAAEARAAQAIAELEEGNEFFSTAVKYSSSSNVFEQADLGWRTQAQLPSLFADVIPGMDKLDVSEPLRNNSGLHIVQLIDARQQVVEELAREQAREYLYQEKMQEAMQAWLIQLRDGAHIDVKATT